MQVFNKKICIYHKKIVSLHPNYGNYYYETVQKDLFEGPKNSAKT